MTRAFKLLKVPPLAATPPAKSENPSFIENHLQIDSSRRETLGDNSCARRLLFKPAAIKSPKIEMINGGGSR